jgi:hypothetical protein
MISLMQRIFGVPEDRRAEGRQLGRQHEGGFTKAARAEHGRRLGRQRLARVRHPTQPQREMPSAGYTYAWENAFNGGAPPNDGGPRRHRGARRARARQFITRGSYCDEQVLIAEAGYVITNTLTAI